MHIHIAFEGVDGAGKSTQAKLLAQWLRAERGVEVLECAEPSQRVLGTQIRSLLADRPPLPETMALLFAADRLDQYRSVVAPALKADVTIVQDRCVWSSLVYQGHGRRGDEHDLWIRSINSKTPHPDLVLLLAPSRAQVDRQLVLRPGPKDAGRLLQDPVVSMRRYEVLHESRTACVSVKFDIRAYPTSPEDVEASKVEVHQHVWRIVALAMDTPRDRWRAVLPTTVVV